LIDYFTNTSFRTELQHVLNRGEAVHAVQRAIHVGRIRPALSPFCEIGFPKSIRFRAGHSKAAESRHHVATQLLVSLLLTTDVALPLI
jgi:hypothetical protein